MSLNLLSPTCFTTGVLIADTRLSFEGVSDSIPSLTFKDGKPISAALEIQSTEGALQLPRLIQEEITALSNPYKGMVLYNDSTDEIDFFSKVTGWKSIGNLVGPTESIIGDIPIFGDTTGQVLADSGVSITQVPPNPNSPIPLSDPFLRIKNLDGISFESDANTLDIGNEVFCYFTRNEITNETKTIFTDSSFDPVSASPSVLLELNSDRATFLNVRMTSGQRTNLLPEPGMQVYDIQEDQMFFYQQGDWTPLGSIVGGATPEAVYIVGTSTSLLPHAQSLGNLSNGLLKNTVEDEVGLLSSAVAGTDYYSPGFPTYLTDTSSIDFITGNLFVGKSSGNSSLTGNQNVGLGINVLSSLDSGSRNTAIGWNAGILQSDYDRCVFIGNLADGTVLGLSNAIAIGSGAQVSTSNTLVLGNGCNVGIGTDSAPYTLTLSNVNGSSSIYLPLGDNEPSYPSSGGVIHVKKDDLDTTQLYFNGEKISTSEITQIIDDLLEFFNLSSFICKSKLPVIGRIEAPFAQSLGTLGDVNTSGLLKNTITPPFVPFLNNVGTLSTAVPVKPDAPFDNMGDYYAPGFPAYIITYSLDEDENLSLYIGDKNIGHKDVNNSTGVGLQAFSFLVGGESNVAFGSEALHNLDSGSNNSGIGTSVFKELSFNSSGNTALGAFAAALESKYTNCTFVGFQSGGTADLTNATAIGYNSQVEADNSLILGKNCNVGIGVPAPFCTLELGNVASQGGTGPILCAILFNNSENLPPNPGEGEGGFLYASNDAIFFNGTQLNGGTFSGLPNNIFGGSNSGNNTLTSTGNIGIGFNTLRLLTTGRNNISLGSYDISAEPQLTVGSNNTLLGANTGNYLTSSDNTAVGESALSGLVEGGSNVAVGSSAGATVGNSNFNNCTFLGSLAGPTAQNLTNATAIGYDADVSTSHSIILGKGCNVAIGTTEAPATLTISNVLNRCYLAIQNTITAPPMPNAGDGGVLYVTDDQLYYNNHQVGFSDRAYVINNDTSDAVQVLTALYTSGVPPYILKLEDSASGIITTATPDLDYVKYSTYQEGQSSQDIEITAAQAKADAALEAAGDAATAAGVAAAAAATAGVLAADAKSDAEEALGKLDDPEIHGSQLKDDVNDAQDTANDAKSKAEAAQSTADSAQSTANSAIDGVFRIASQGVILTHYPSAEPPLSFPNAQYLDQLSDLPGLLYCASDGTLSISSGGGGGDAPSNAPYVVTTAFAGLTGSIQALDTLGGPGGVYCDATGVLSLSNPSFIVQTINTNVPAAQSLGSLETGLLKNTVNVATGILSTAEAGIDYYAPGFPTYIMDTAGTTENLFIGNNLESFANLGSSNVLLGFNVSPISIDYSRCIGIGIDILLQNEGDDNIAIGNQALRLNNTGTRLIGIGSKSQANNLSGNDNLSFGARALYQNQDGSSNIALGSNSLLNALADNNIGIGQNSLLNNVGGYENIAIGKDAFSGTIIESTTLTYQNIVIGNEAFTGTLEGAFDNIIMGYQTVSELLLPYQVQGTVIIGNNSGNDSKGFINSTFLGHNIQYTGPNILTNSTAIGANSTVGLDNSVILGNGCNVGIGNPSPLYTVHVSNVLSPLSNNPSCSIYLEATTNLPDFTSGGGILYIEGTDLYFNSTGTPLNLTNGGSGSAPLDAAYILGTLPSPNPFTGAYQNLGALGDGILINTVTAGVGTLSVGGAGTAYYSPGHPLYLFSQSQGDIGISGQSINPLPANSNYNLFIGSGALQGATTNIESNVALGHNTLNLLQSGNNNTVTGYASGSLATSGGNNAFYGFEAGASYANYQESVLIGSGADATDTALTGVVSIGYLSVAGNNSVSIGNGANASSINSISIGSASITTLQDSIAIGDSANCAGANGIGIGFECSVNGTNSVGIGTQIEVTGSSSTALGTAASVSGNQSTSIGYLAQANGNNSTAIGALSVVNGDNAIVLGTSITNVGIGNPSPNYTLDIITTGQTSFQGVVLPGTSINTAPVISGQAYVQVTGSDTGNHNFVHLLQIPLSAYIGLNYIVNVEMQISAIEITTGVGYGGFVNGVYMNNPVDPSNSKVITNTFLTGSNQTERDQWDDTVSIYVSSNVFYVDVTGSKQNDSYTTQWFITYRYSIFTEQS